MNSSDILRQLARPACTAVPGGLLPTGSVSLDSLLGGGWPAAAISEIAGPSGYADPLAYRTIAAVQRAHPDRTAVLCAGFFSVHLARRYEVDSSRLMVTSIAEDAVSAGEHSPCIAVVDRTMSAEIPVRGDKELTTLYITREPGEIRSAACIRLSQYGGSPGWAWAQRMWNSAPPWPRFASMPVCLGSSSAFVQELLDAAVLLDIVRVRSRQYSYGEHHIGRGWKAAVHELRDASGLQLELLAEVSGHMPAYPGWRQAYT